MNHTFIVTHSAGELDIILPIIVDLLKKKSYDILPKKIFLTQLR